VTTVRLFAAARAAAGGQRQVPSAAPSLDALRTELAERFGPGMDVVLKQCAFLVDGVTVHRGCDRDLSDAVEVDVLPPFAGG
jgi:sulfur-carrier protein